MHADNSVFISHSRSFFLHLIVIEYVRGKLLRPDSHHHSKRLAWYVTHPFFIVYRSVVVENIKHWNPKSFLTFSGPFFKIFFHIVENIIGCKSCTVPCFVVEKYTPLPTHHAERYYTFEAVTPLECSDKFFLCAVLKLGSINIAVNHGIISFHSFVLRDLIALLIQKRMQASFFV